MVFSNFGVFLFFRFIKIKKKNENQALSIFNKTRLQVLFINVRPLCSTSNKKTVIQLLSDRDVIVFVITTLIGDMRLPPSKLLLRK